MNTLLLTTAFAMSATLASAASTIGTVTLDQNNNPVGEPKYVDSDFDCGPTIEYVKVTMDGYAFIELGSNQYIVIGPSDKAALICIER